MPSKYFSGLYLWKVISLGNVKDRDGKARSTDQVDEVMVCKVHGGPPNPHDIQAERDTSSRQEMLEVKCVEGCPASVQRGESAEDDGGSRK